MRSPFLTTIERQSYEQVPSEIPSYDLLTYFQFSDRDRALISMQRRPTNQLGFALQLSLIRYMGFLPVNWMAQLPDHAVRFVSGQLSLKVSDLQGYGQRAATLTSHLKSIMRYIGWRRFEHLDVLMMERWILERSMEHDRERILLEMACQKLKQEHILRPAIMQLEKMVVGALLATDKEMYRRLAPLLSPEIKERLDGLLVVDTVTRTSPHRWLARPASSNSPTAIREAIQKLLFLKELSVTDWDTDMLNTNRSKRLARIARKKTSQAIRRYVPERRYPLLIAFLRESYLDITDAVLTMFSDYWETMVGKCKREMKVYQQQVVQTKDRTLEMLVKIATLITDEEHIEDGQLRASIYDHLSKDSLLEVVDTCQVLLRPTRNSYLYFMENRYTVIRRFSPQLLTQLSFQFAYQKDDFAEAMQLVTEMQVGIRRKLPGDVPMDFLTPIWKDFVHGAESRLRSPAYQIGVLSTLRDRLRSGDVFVEESRKFADLDSYLIPSNEWGRLRSGICRQLDMPKKVTERIDERVQELVLYLPILEQLLKEGKDIRIEDGNLVLSPIRAEEVPDTFLKLDEHIGKQIPEVDLSDIIVEVDGWLNFTDNWPDHNGKALEPPFVPYLYAALLATACNIPLKDMARSASLNYQKLWWLFRSDYASSFGLMGATPKGTAI